MPDRDEQTCRRCGGPLTRTWDPDAGEAVWTCENPARISWSYGKPIDAGLPEPHATTEQLRAQEISNWPFTPEETELLFDLACMSRERDFHHDNYVLRNPTPQAQHDWNILNGVINKLYLQGDTEEDEQEAAMSDRAVVDDDDDDILIMPPISSRTVQGHVTEVRRGEPLVHMDDFSPQPRATCALSADRQWLVVLEPPSRWQREFRGQHCFYVWARRGSRMSLHKLLGPDTGQNANEVLAQFLEGRG